MQALVDQIDWGGVVECDDVVVEVADSVDVASGILHRVPLASVADLFQPSKVLRGEWL